MKKPLPSVLGIGTAVPPHSIEQSHAAEIAASLCCNSDVRAGRLRNLYLQTQVDRRGSVLLEPANGHGPGQSFFPASAGERRLSPGTEQRMERYALEALPLAAAASRQALEESKTAPEQISQLVTVSCTGFAAPGVDIRLIKELGLRQTVGRTHVGFMGCHGALNGLRVASSLCAQEPEARVLLCAVELCSLHFYCGWEMDKMVANALFADGAAAFVLGGPAESGWRIAANGSCIFPDSEEAMSWRIGDHGFEMTLSPRVPSLIASHLKPWADRWLAGHGLSIGEIRSWAIHPGGPKILTASAEALGIDEAGLSVSKEVLAQRGNMSSPTLLFILDQLRRQEAPLPCVALGFGPGLALEAVLFS